MQLNIKSNSISILTDPLRQFHFDDSGRLIGFFDHGNHYRVGLDGTILFKNSMKELKEKFLQDEDISQLVESWGKEFDEWKKVKPHDLNINYFHDRSVSPIEIFLKVAERIHNYNSLKKEFQDVYGKIPIVPPEYYQSVIVNFSSGCSFDQCSFCSFYKEKPYKVRTVDQLTAHLSSISSFLGEGIGARRDIFIGEANALAIPQKRFTELMHHLNQWVFNQKEKYPEFRVHKVGTFLDGFSSKKRTLTEWKEIKGLGLTDIAIGCESGDEDLLKQIGKPYNLSQMIDLVSRLKDSGFNLNLIFMIGLGGKNWIERHKEYSLKMISKLHLNEKDRLQLSLFNTDLAPNHYPYKNDGLLASELEKEYMGWKKSIQQINSNLQVRKYPTQYFIL